MFMDNMTNEKRVDDKLQSAMRYRSSNKSCLWDIIGLGLDIELMVRERYVLSWLEKHKSVVGSALHLDERSLISNKLGKLDNWSLNGYFVQLAHFS